jgi:hypothetical protein
MAKNLAKKVSVSLPQDVINFLDTCGTNRSKIIVTIIEEYKAKKNARELESAYEQYSQIFNEDNEDIDIAVLNDLQEEV